MRAESIHICEVVLERLLALESTIGYLTNLIAVEAFPPLRVENVYEVDYKVWMNEVDKSVSHVASIFVVDW